MRRGIGLCAATAPQRGCQAQLRIRYLGIQSIERAEVRLGLGSVGLCPPRVGIDRPRLFPSRVHVAAHHGGALAQLGQAGDRIGASRRASHSLR